MKIEESVRHLTFCIEYSIPGSHGRTAHATPFTDIPLNCGKNVTSRRQHTDFFDCLRNGLDRHLAQHYFPAARLLALITFGEQEPHTKLRAIVVRVAILFAPGPYQIMLPRRLAFRHPEHGSSGSSRHAGIASSQGVSS